MSFTSYSVDNDRIFSRALARVRATTNDLTIPLTLISKDFYRSERAIFQLASEGKYPDLKQATKNYKQLNFGFIYPILKRTGRLAKSLTDATAGEAINVISNKKSLVIGTRVPYGIYHQSDKPRLKIPLRKFLFIGPEAPSFANDDQMGRLERWANTMNDYVLQKIEQQGFKVNQK